MNKTFLGIALLGALAPTIARAQDAPPPLAAPVAATGVAATSELALVAPFIADLKEPQGLALDSNGDIVVCDYGAGEVVKFNAQGEGREVLADGLKNPSQITFVTTYDPQENKTARQWIVSERKADRVVQLRDGVAAGVGGRIVEPMGVLQTSGGRLYAIAHTTSEIYRLDKNGWTPVHSSPDAEGAARYGLRCLASDGETLFFSDEINGDITMMSSDGRTAKFASGIEDPSGLAVRGDWLYVCDESNGGQLWKVSKDGVKTLVAKDLGRPRNVLFTADNMALVSDRNGRVLKLVWAK